MYEAFKERYFKMKSEILKIAGCKPLVLSRLQTSDEDVQATTLRWLVLIETSASYQEAKQRYKEVDKDRLAYYKLHGMMDFPEIAYRKQAFKVLKQLWLDTMPEVVRRKEHGKRTPNQQENGDLRRSVTNTA